MSSGFISETEIIEARRRRQEEWDKVRTEDQPKEAPEEPYDTRPLYQRLEEQRLKREAEYEEAHKLKNMIKGLDDDEVGFLDLVEQTKAKAAHQISLEEQKEMQDYRERVSSLSESEEMSRLRAQLAPARPAPAQKQTNKLQGVIVRKRKLSDTEKDKKDADVTPVKMNGVNYSKPSRESTVILPPSAGVKGALQCVGVLPGLGPYADDSSSDSDNSSDIETGDSCCKRDLLGRRPEALSKSEKDSKS